MWFRHKISGQVFEAEGMEARMHQRNRDCEEIAPPTPSGDNSPASGDSEAGGNAAKTKTGKG